MYILLSPSKSLDFVRSYTQMPATGHKPFFTVKTKQLHHTLKVLSQIEIAHLMHISDALAALNYDRFQKWSGTYTKQVTNDLDEKNFVQALSAFTGDVYKGFSLDRYTSSDWHYADEHIGIISGFYGLLSPLTYMKPYRLEMGTRLDFAVGKKQYRGLYDYWRDELTAYVDGKMSQEKILLNLASMEYAKAVDFSAISGEVITAHFKVRKGKQYRVVGISAKFARGEMANAVVKGRLKKVEDLYALTPAGFVYNKKLSTTSDLVFVKK